jgi:hypothetical protein
MDRVTAPTLAARAGAGAGGHLRHPDARAEIAPFVARRQGIQQHVQGSSPSSARGEVLFFP